ncbi:Dehydroquinase [Dactylonectria macrodidyma]|uniref:Catabolic 3-dehydroquinase n=1 Tax=Dactylonectria macrodidyma TaxID=307937 RepID=A0A9P9ISJ9_9HYPO|nr:Dehydroquinase [Dactylonectria macrodidyma]
MGHTILLINGPNLNLLGAREPHIYGSTTLDDVITTANSQASELNAVLQDFQSNHEGAIVDRIHQARGNVDAIIINPGALTHTSVALRDALLGVDIPFIEIHVTNPHARETFRHRSYLCDKATAVICGMGTHGYSAALEFAAKHIKAKRSQNNTSQKVK